MVYEQTGNDNAGAVIYSYGLTRISAKSRIGLTDEQSIRYYYLYNAHGDVVRTISGTNQTVKTYDYDAFGNDRDPITTDNNPFRYCGEYFDTATETYFLRARWYDPATGRFTQQDSWVYYKPDDPLSLNLYLYCYGNPVMYVDPSGNIVIVESKNDMDIVSTLMVLSDLTDYLLSYNWETNEVTYTANNQSNEYPIGNELISILIDSNHTIFINAIRDGFSGNGINRLSEDKVYYNGVGGDARITFDLDSDPGIYTKVYGENYSTLQKRPAYIGLAHELIHALHYVQGEVIPSNYTITNNYYIRKRVLWRFFKTQLAQESEEAEEFYTVGLSDYKHERFTENAIRREHGLPIRTAYNVPY